MNNCIAVLLPVYKNDREDFLCKSIESILYQTYNNFRLFIGVDGPIGDNLKHYLERLALQSKITILYFDTNRGLACVLNDLINSVIALNSEYTASCGAVCSFRPEDDDLMVFADEGQISQIFINLIKNALQAGAKHIDITAKMGKDDEVIVDVANDGEPIPTSSQEQIFIPFYTTKKEGSGIGLSISRQIMRNHNGSIELTQSDASRTVFELIFR